MPVLTKGDVGRLVRQFDANETTGVTVKDASVNTNSIIVITLASGQTAANAPAYVKSKSAGSFVVVSVAGDTDTYDYAVLS